MTYVDFPESVISLCAGVGGLELGLRVALPSLRVVCYVEREAVACETLARAADEGLAHPAPIWTDLRTFDGKPWRGRVSGIVGGYPCQPVSVAGKQLGEDDDRWLWPDVARIIREVDPGWCFFENVGNHLNLGFDVVARDLEALSFRVAPGLFTAEEVGATHKRERLFILAYRHGLRELQQDWSVGAERRWARDSGEVVEHSARIGEREPNDEARTESRADTWKDAGGGRGLMDDPTGNGRREGRTGESRDEGRSRTAGSGHRLGEESKRVERDELFAWPPGPEDHEGWAAVIAAGRLDLLPAVPQSTFRDMADGVARRVDELRAGGNGVVALQAAAALVWLARDAGIVE